MASPCRRRPIEPAEIELARRSRNQKDRRDQRDVTGRNACQCLHKMNDFRGSRHGCFNTPTNGRFLYRSW